MTIAALDLGTHTFLLLVARSAPAGAPSPEPIVLHEALRFVRLGEGLAESKRLSPAAIARGLDAISEYRKIITEHEARPCAVGTQALREAENAMEFLIPARKILGCGIEIVTGLREVELAARAAMESFPDLQEFVVMDIGGGSTEFARVNVNVQEIGGRVSLPLGTVRLRETCFEHDPVTVEEIEAAEVVVQTALAPLPKNLPGPTNLVGVSGTVTTLAAMHLELPAYDGARVHGLQLGRDHVEKIIERLVPLSVDERKKLPGLEPERADVILPGALLVRDAMKVFGVEHLRVCDRGLRWGLLYEQLSGLSGVSHAPPR